ncbi:Arylsulfatase [Planctomycetes bacterium MalM25]|nr:Arylsulfatase [Planctomycetes bacterium MalM25]
MPRLLTLIVTLSVALVPFVPAVGRMNVVLILADDLGRHDLSCTGSDLYHTPHIDRLASESLSFAQAYSSHPTCSPSRSAILSGKCPAKLGIVSHGALRKVVGGGDGTFLVPEEYTLAEALRDAGYTTGHVGKWHVGKEGKAGPKEQGFHHDLASNEFCCTGSFFYPYTKKGKDGEVDAASAVPDLADRGPEDHLTEALAEEAVEFIGAHKEETFFLNLWTYAVHTPIQAERDKVKKYKSILDNRPADATQHQTNPNYAGLVEHLDDCVGRVMKAIEANGLADNTIVIFTSDNGGEIRNGVTNNYPLRNGKVSQYLGGTRVPLFVRWPGVTKPTAVCDTAVIGHDLYPTILGMTGVAGDATQNAAMDGRDLTPLLRDPTGAELDRDTLHWLRHPVVFHYRNQMDEPGMGPCGSVVRGDWKLIELLPTPQGVEQSFELYNLRNDPSETTNLAEQYPGVVAELSAAMVAWREEVDAPKYESAYAEYEKIKAP